MKQFCCDQDYDLPKSEMTVPCNPIRELESSISISWSEDHKNPIGCDPHDDPLPWLD